MMRFLFLATCVLLATVIDLTAQNLRAGAAKVDITHPDQPAGDNPLFVKALVVSDEAAKTHAVIITLDVVAVAEIGSVKDPYLADVRAALKKDLGLDPKSVLVNASHCHGVPCQDVAARTIQAVKAAWKNRVPVRTGAGSGHEDRIQVNRRIHLKDGRQIDVRHAYSMPNDDDVAAVGPIDPEIGILRLDRADTGEPLAIVYNFACHPIQGVPGGGNTADLTGFASQVIEDNLGDGVIALFVQGCGGDINPANYKAVDQPRDGRPLGNLLGLSTLKTARKIETRQESPLQIVNETLDFPRADLAPRISEMETEIDALLDSLKGTTLNLKTFIPLYVKYHLNGNYPAADAHRYLQDELLKQEDWKHLDEQNRKNLDAYIWNIRTMEELTRKQINLALLKKHHARNEAAGMKPVPAEVVGLRVGDFRLVTFPAEVTVPIGLNIKKASPHEHTFVAGYTNGYLYYAPTAEQLKNRGNAQEDSDCLLAPAWQALFEQKAAEMLNEER